MKKISKDYFKEIFEILEAEFPLDEYRDSKEQLELLDLDIYSLYGDFDQYGNLMVFAAFWEFDSFSFLEHYAVKKEYQGKGVGKSFLKEYIAGRSQPLFLEVELPENEICKRRISFYERLGLFTSSFPYFQQPLRQGLSPKPLMIMSTIREYTETDFAPYKKIIYKEVYKTEL